MGEKRPETCAGCAFRDMSDGMCWHPDAEPYPLVLDDEDGQCEPHERCPLPPKEARS